MKLRYEDAANVVRRAVLMAACVLLGHSAGFAQTLTASANPSSGAAGVHTSYLTGSGFPAGAITGATVHFGATCAAPALASAPVTQVASIGPLRRFQFLIPASLAPGSYKAWVSGTAGTTAFNTLDRRSCSSITATASVQGTASLGAAIAGAAVTLVDFNGNVRTGTTASDGSFAFSTGGLTPPFLVKVVTATDSDEFPAGTTLYSVSTVLNPSQRINVHVLTDLMVRSFYAAQGIDVADAFVSPTGNNAPPSPSAVRALANLVIPAVQLWLNNAGVEATGDAPTGDAINLISTPFVAYPPGVTPPGGLDAVLHQIVSEEVNADGSVEEITIAGGGITEVINPEYQNGLITLNTTTTNASGGGSAGTFFGLALTSDIEPTVNGINALVSAFTGVLNTKQTSLTVADILPYYHPDFLQDGMNAQQAAQAEVDDSDELAGVTITGEVVGILSLNNGVAHVVVGFVLTNGTETESGYDEFYVKEAGGTWLLYGNQRVADVGVTVQARRSQGGAGAATGTFVFAGASAPVNTVNTVTVAGPVNNPGFNIWSGAASQALIKGAQHVENGQVSDEWFLLSSPLGNTIAEVAAKVPVGSTFNFTLTTNGLGTPLYSDQSNAITTEIIQFNGLPASSSATRLPEVLGSTKTYNFTLPSTYPIAGVFLFGHAIANNQLCNFGATGPLTLDMVNHTGSGSIAIPINLNYCGVAGAITFVSVFLEVEGVNGEISIVQLGYPY